MTEDKNLWTKSTCAYCGVGCGIEASLDAKGELNIRGDKSHPANFGNLCSKGLALGETVSHDGRLLQPSINGVESDWPTALQHVAEKFSQTIEEFGPDSVAFYVSGQLLTEDYYVANKLMKGFIGSGNIDTNSRLCMSSSVVGYKRAFGTDTVPGCYEDLDTAELVVITGSNLAWCHPVIFQRLKAEKEKRDNLFIVVIDPRETDTCSIADLHLAIQPETDVTLFNGLLAYLAEHNKLDQDYIQAHSEGFDTALEAAQQSSQDLTQVAATLNVSEQDLTTFYQHFADTEKSLSIYSQGTNQSTQGSSKVNSIINTHIATGRIGKPGMGPFSITGQPNAMGGREVGGLANMLAAHMEFGDPEAHQMISDFWQTEQLATQQGLKAVDMFDAINEGKIKAVWVMATNPVVSLPNSNKIIAALEKCPLVVVSDCMAETATTKYADVLLPAQGWSEKSGTVTNSERRISRQRRLLPSPGAAKADWWIICEVAKRMGFADAFTYLHEGEVFTEFAKMTTLGNEDGLKRDLNLIGLTQLDAKGYSQLTPQQWPVTTLQTENIHQRMFTDKQFFTASKKAQFIAVSPTAQKPKNAAYPLILNSGRIRDHWHTMTRTGLSSRLGAHIAEPFVAINPEDAKTLNIENDSLVAINSEQGATLVRAKLTERQSKGQMFSPIHWNKQTAKSANVCNLVSDDNDPVSGQPGFKSTQVNVKKWHYHSEAMLLTRESLDLELFDYWVKQKVEQGYLYRIADNRSPIELAETLQGLLNNKLGKTLQFSTTEQSLQAVHRYAFVKDSKLSNAYITAAQLTTHSLEWLQSVLDLPLDSSIELTLISGIVQGKLAQGKIICACKQVGINTITEAIQDQGCQSLDSIKSCTSAGTGCGSCVPEVSNILADYLENNPHLVTEAVTSNGVEKITVEEFIV
ncbi:nitrate reductase [Psychromonas algicola]|uniref:nitrate reductase n=1 Tax=Psychromonas algicola TaxID=2555642 RepID=UPI0010672273|nr:nitrate reductase [Psychromonas sp. RZ5]TEW50690.1 nitrate reductase [Psychromonas sp. RZ5]